MEYDSYVVSSVESLNNFLYIIIYDCKKSKFNLFPLPYNEIDSKIVWVKINHKNIISLRKKLKI